MAPGKYGLQGILTATGCLCLVYQPYSPLLHMMQASTACAAISASDSGPRCGRHRKEDHAAQRLLSRCLDHVRETT